MKYLVNCKYASCLSSKEKQTGYHHSKSVFAIKILTSCKKFDCSIHLATVLEYNKLSIIQSFCLIKKLQAALLLLEIDGEI